MLASLALILVFVAFLAAWNDGPAPYRAFAVAWSYPVAPPSPVAPEVFTIRRRPVSPVAPLALTVPDATACPALRLQDLLGALGSHGVASAASRLVAHPLVVQGSPSW